MIDAHAIAAAWETVSRHVVATPCPLSQPLSKLFGGPVYLKMENLQVTGSFKERGACWKLAALSPEERARGVVTASAGNHAQAVAYHAARLQIAATVVMPQGTPQIKVARTRELGGHVVLYGTVFDDAYDEALRRAEQAGLVFVSPYDDDLVIAGQGTCGLEILQQVHELGQVLIPVGGGGLISGVGSYFRQVSPQTKIIGVEPAGAPSMKRSLEAGEAVTLAEIDKFVDGAAVQRVGDLPFEIGRKVIDDIVLVPEGRVCTKILELDNRDAIVVEPAGALSIAALDYYADQIRGKNVVCIVSGSNNDITRTEEIKERSLLFEGLKHYFIIRFPQRAGALRLFVDKVLGEGDDITHFGYTKKNNREKGPAFVGIELSDKKDLEGLLMRMREHGFIYEYMNEKPDLFQYLI